uniref:CSON004952 protein n=1 Tax=Culicoides sonorensis TaxID=179676 RepID=A0A336MPS8_CULSO
MKLNKFMLLTSKTFAIISYFSVCAQTFNYTYTNNVTGPTAYITTTIASILTNNFSYPTTFVPNVSPITFQHKDAILNDASNTFNHQHPVPASPILHNDMIMFGNEVKSLSELPLETLLKIKKHLEEITLGMTSQTDTSGSANTVYPVYEQPSHQGALSQGYLNTVGHQPVGGHLENVDDYSDDSYGVNGQFTKNTGIINFHDHSKTDNERFGFITPQPFIHKFKKKTAAEPWDEKPSKIQTIFQVSVTALSFLAFGGYLLCMILSALKAKGSGYYTQQQIQAQLLGNKVQQQNNKRPVQNSPVIKPPKRRPSYGRRRRRRRRTVDDKIDKSSKFGINGIFEQNFANNQENVDLPFNHEQMFDALISIAEGYVKFNDISRK